MGERRAAARSDSALGGLGASQYTYLLPLAYSRAGMDDSVSRSRINPSQIRLLAIPSGTCNNADTWCEWARSSFS